MREKNDMLRIGNPVKNKITHFKLYFIRNIKQMLIFSYLLVFQRDTLELVMEWFVAGMTELYNQWLYKTIIIFLLTYK